MIALIILIVFFIVFTNISFIFSLISNWSKKTTISESFYKIGWICINVVSLLCIIYSIETLRQFINMI